MLKRATIPLFSALAILHTWPILRQASSHVINEGDGLLNVWLLAAVSRRLLRHPLTLFDINMYYPYRGALATLDHQLSAVLLVAPLTLVTGNPFLATNLFTIATFALSGVFTTWLIADLTGSRAGGLIGGCLYAFSAMRLENIDHTHVLGNCWLPLALLALHRYTRAPSWGRLGLAVAASLLFALATWYYAVIGAIALAVVAAGDVIRFWPTRWVIVRRGLAGAAAAALILGALARPYVTITHEFLSRVGHASDVSVSMDHAEPEASIDRSMNRNVIQTQAAPIEGYLSVSPATVAPWTSPLRGLARMAGASFFPGVAGAIFAGIAVVLVFRHQVRASPLAWIPIAMIVLTGLSSAAAALGHPDSPLITATWTPGFYLLMLALLTTWLLTAPEDPSSPAGWIAPARIYVVLAAFGVVFSLGEHVRAFKVTIGHGVYPAELPPFNLLRVASRFGTMYLIGLAVLAGFGYAAVARRVRRPFVRLAIAGAALVIINVELFAAPFPMLRVREMPEAYGWLKRAEAGAVIDFPIHQNLWGLYWSLFHGHPLSNGFGLVDPMAFQELKGPDDLSPEMLEHIRAYFHPRYVVVNWHQYGGERGGRLAANLARSEATLTSRARFDTREVFEVGGPSRGAPVVRSYQPWMLARKRGIALHARLDDTPAARGTSVVQVWGNGRLLTAAAAEPGRADAALFAPLPADLSRGLDIEVMGDYTLPAGAGAAIGRTGRRAPVDIELRVDPHRTRLQVNGHVWFGQKGYTVLTIAPDGRVDLVRAFNTSWSEAESHALSEQIRAVPPGWTVAIASTYDASRALTADAVDALRTLGISTDLRGRFGWAHAAVGVKGAEPGSAAESVGATGATCIIGAPVLVPVAVDGVRVY